MTIPLFFGDARRSLLIRSWSVPQGRGTDKQANAIEQKCKPKGDSTPDDLAALNKSSVGILNPRPVWSQQELGVISPRSLPPFACLFVNNLVGLNAVEVFHVRS